MADAWWDPIEVAVGSSWSRPIGKGTLTIEHDAFEWRIGVETTEAAQPPASLRIATDSDDCALTLGPRLADRSVVARLEVPLRIAAGDRATIYVGSPLWAEVQLGSSSTEAVGELRFYDPPNTWFGPNTREGELCYASRTTGRLRRDVIEHQGDRAITPVVISNLSDAPLVFERVRIPIPRLTLWLADDESLWTNRLLINHSKEVSDEIETKAPTALDVGEFRELAGPREVAETNLFTRAIGALL